MAVDPKKSRLLAATITSQSELNPNGKLKIDFGGEPSLEVGHARTDFPSRL